jgi:hypothetical protein
VLRWRFLSLRDSSVHASGAGHTADRKTMETLGCHRCRGRLDDKQRPHKRCRNFLKAKGECTRPYPVYNSSTSNHAARRREKAADAEETYDAKMRSAIG